MGVAFDGYCFADDAALVFALNVRAERVDNLTGNYVAFWHVGGNPADGQVLAYISQYYYQSQNNGAAWMGDAWGGPMNFPSCDTVGPIDMYNSPGDILNTEFVASLLLAALPVMAAAALWRWLRGVS